MVRARDDFFHEYQLLVHLRSTVAASLAPRAPPPPARPRRPTAAARARAAPAPAPSRTRAQREKDGDSADRVRVTLIYIFKPPPPCTVSARACSDERGVRRTASVRAGRRQGGGAIDAKELAELLEGGEWVGVCDGVADRARVLVDLVVVAAHEGLVAKKVDLCACGWRPVLG